MRAIIIGLGDVGQHVARTLSAERYDVTIVDQDAARVESAQGDLDALVLPGNGASPKFLREIGAGDADIVCAVTQTDEVNVIAAVAARHLGAGQTVARVRDSDYFGTNQSFASDVMGIDFVIHPERATAEDLAEAIQLPGSVHVEYLADGRIAIAEAILTERSPLVGQMLGRRRMVRPHSVVGVITNGRAQAADPMLRLRAGNHVIVAAERDDIGPVIAHLAGHTQTMRDVIIFGGGRVGFPLARLLEAGHRLNVTVMERDAERARFIAERLTSTTVLHEEGLSKEVLLAHGVDRTGAFVAAAGDDRANLLAALNAKQLGTDLCLAVVSREEFTPLVDALGIDAGFSPRLVTAEAILRAARGSQVEALHLMLVGAEVVVVQVDAGSLAEGRTAKRAGESARTNVAAILRGKRVIIPDGEEALQAGDRVVAFNPRRGVSDLGRAFKSG